MALSTVPVSTVFLAGPVTCNVRSQSGRCRVCGYPKKYGQQVTKFEFAEGPEWVHTECPDPANRYRAVNGPCKKCFIELPTANTTGICDECA